MVEQFCSKDFFLGFLSRFPLPLTPVLLLSPLHLPHFSTLLIQKTQTIQHCSIITINCQELLFFEKKKFFFFDDEGPASLWRWPFIMCTSLLIQPPPFWPHLHTNAIRSIHTSQPTQKSPQKSGGKKGGFLRNAKASCPHSMAP